MCLLTSLKSQILCLNRIIVRPMSLINITEFIYLFSTSRLVSFILSTLYIYRDKMAEWRSLKCSKCFFNQNFCNPFLYMHRKTHLKKPILDKLVNNESSVWKVFADFRNSWNSLDRANAMNIWLNISPFFQYVFQQFLLLFLLFYHR